MDRQAAITEIRGTISNDSAVIDAYLRNLGDLALTQVLIDVRKRSAAKNKDGHAPDVKLDIHPELTPKKFAATPAHMAHGMASATADLDGIWNTFVGEVMGNPVINMANYNLELGKDGIAKFIDSWIPTIEGMTRDDVDMSMGALKGVIMDYMTIHLGGRHIEVIAIPARVPDANGNVYTTENVDKFLVALGVQTPQEARHYLHEHPGAVEHLEKLSRRTAILMLSSTKLMDWLTKNGPAVQAIMDKVFGTKKI